MQLREKPRGGHLSITGNVVNVPADVTTIVKKLPRVLSQNETIPLKLNRSLNFKHSVAFERIRPNKVNVAAKWLMQNSVLFQSEGIEMDQEWEFQNQEYESDENSEEILMSKSGNDCLIDSWTEDTNLEDRPSGNTDAMLQSIDFREFNQILSVAPGENNTLLSIFQDKYSEFLAFPAIYCGQSRPDNASRLVPLHYSTICK